MKTEQIGLGLSARNRRFRATKPISIRASTNKRDPGRLLCEAHNEIRRTRVTGNKIKDRLYWIVYWPGIILIVAAIIALIAHGTDAL